MRAPLVLLFALSGCGLSQGGLTAPAVPTTVSGSKSFTDKLAVGTSTAPVATMVVNSQATSGAGPTAWGADHFVVGGTGATSGGVGTYYDSTGNIGHVLALSPNVAWRPLHFNASSYVFTDNASTPAAVFTVSNAGDLTSTSTKTRGTINLSGGTGTATVNSGAICVCTDSTAVAAVRCSVSGTTLTATGTTTDAIKYICMN